MKTASLLLDTIGAVLSMVGMALQWTGAPTEVLCPFLWLIVAIMSFSNILITFERWISE